MLIPTLLLALVLFWTGLKVSNACRNRVCSSSLYVIALLVSLPGIYYAIYYLHLFPDFAWYYELRALPYTELLASGIGFLPGILVGFKAEMKSGNRILLLITFTGLLTIPYLKPLLTPLDESIYQEKWQGNISMQSTPFSCGPASTATIAKQLGVDLREKQIAMQAYTYLGGTEAWYLARVMRRANLNYKFIKDKNYLKNIKTPVIAGVILKSGLGHFIPILSFKNGIYTTGDPGIGLRNYDYTRLTNEYKFTGFFLEIRKKRQD